MHKLILGTNTGEVPKSPSKGLTTGFQKPVKKEPNYLMIAKVDRHVAHFPGPIAS